VNIQNLTGLPGMNIANLQVAYLFTDGY